MLVDAGVGLSIACSRYFGGGSEEGIPNGWEMEDLKYQLNFSGGEIQLTKTFVLSLSTPSSSLTLWGLLMNLWPSCFLSAL